MNQTRRFSTFDLTVIGALTGVALLIGLLIWRGDQVGLQVLSTTPADGSAGVSTRSRLQLVFDQPLDRATEARLTFEPPVDGELRVEGDRLTFAPDALQPDTFYTVRLEPGVRGANGRTLGAALIWRFATGRTQALFTRTNEGREQLFTASVMMQPGSDTVAAQAVQITQMAGGVWDYAVSPVDGRIVFSALTPTGSSDLWIIEPGGEPQRLLDCTADFCSSPSWSHDGELLLFSQRNASEFGAAAVNPPRLSIVHVTSGELAPVFRDNQKLGFEARWSSDNRWITYLSPDFIGIGVYNLESGEDRFYSTQAGEAAPWQPGQARFVMNEQRILAERSAIHLFLVDPIADTRVNLSGEEAMVEDGAAVWSPDGEWIAFRRNITEGPGATLTKQLWLMRADGSAARALTTDAEIDHGPPTWSPDGRSLIFHKFPLKGPDIVISVWVLDVESGEQWQVASPGQRPQWLP